MVHEQGHLELLTRRGYDIVQRLSALPDEDFVYLANARYFLPSGGGYGGQASIASKDSMERRAGGAGFVIEELSADSKGRAQ